MGVQQQSLFETGARVARRIALDAESWVDYAPRWADAPDALFAELRDSRQWGQRTRHLYDREVLEPRLTSRWLKGEVLEPPALAAMLARLDAAYGVEFDSIGFNWYRDGNDSVAPHGDKIVKHIAEPIVALVSLGATRRFVLKPRAGGKSMHFDLASGDLLVTGGKTQRTWLHSIPKVAHAGPRISLAFRYGLHPNAYGK
jgi:alkylated DNA repair dioxygenase AlkB